jgi:hypothetical protein
MQNPENFDCILIFYIYVTSVSLHVGQHSSATAKDVLLHTIAIFIPVSKVS